MNCSGYSVTVKQTEVVAAALPVQEHWLPMSNLDLLLPPLDFGTFFCYEKNSHILSQENKVGVLKKSLAQALVSFYPFAGEIVLNRQNEPEILCNNRGVEFTHAYADVELTRLDLYRPEHSVHQKLVPVKMYGLLSVQVSELRCGGIVVGCTFDHRAADAHSANMFLTAWAEIARAKPVTRLPSFRRSFFNPRRPLQPHKSLEQLYAPLLDLPPPPSDKNNEIQDRLTSRIYHVKSESIDLIQSQCSSNNTTKRTKIESFSAFLWKTLANTSLNPSNTVKLGVVVNGRTRLGTGTSLENYFGNVLTVPYVEASVGELQTTSFKAVADIVHECVANAVMAEHFRALIDWVELRRPKPAVVKVYCKDENDEAAVVVSSGRGFPVNEVDFGWGKPVFGSYHFPWGGETGYVMPMPSANGNGDWIVYMHMKERHLDLIESCSSQVFTPFSSNHLYD